MTLTHNTAPSEHWKSLLEFDRQHIWHPYAKTPNPLDVLGVISTCGSHITLANQQVVVDGMSSWWAAIHGYNHPEICAAMHQQIDTMPHIMFGGLTHEPAIALTKTLLNIVPPGLDKVFYSDSGSVAMEVAIKMALQYWISQQRLDKNRLLTVRNGYHGDTFATMAVCDPDNGMHPLFGHLLTPHLFAPAPHLGFDRSEDDSDIAAFEALLSQHHPHIAAVTIEPIVQGAGGMRFYRPDYLKQVRALCTQYNVLLIVDEIATGFGRTGKLFASEWAGITPDIMCIGKALTGGTVSLAATLCTQNVSDGVSQGQPGLLMHGPTFMANPLACSAALASIDVLLNSPWQTQIADIAAHLSQHLSPLKTLRGVVDVRVLGAIGVVELERNDLGLQIQTIALQNGAWLRPFGNLVYTMPAFNIAKEDLQTLTDALINAVKQVLTRPGQTLSIAPI